MEKIRKLIGLTFKGVSISDGIYEDQRFKDFIDGSSASLIFCSDGSQVSFLSGEEKEGKILSLSRKNKDKISIKKLGVDLSASVYTIKNDGTGDEDSNKTLSIMAELKDQFKTESSILTKDLIKQEEKGQRTVDMRNMSHRGLCSLYFEWKEQYESTLDMSIKDRMVYYIGIWENIEGDLAILKQPSINRVLPFDWCLDVVNFACSCIFSMRTTDPALSPKQTELKQIASGLISDFVARSEEEYINSKWWENESIIDRCKKWIDLFHDMARLLGENLSDDQTTLYEDIQMSNHTKTLEMMIGVFEIMKQAKIFQRENKLLEDESNFFNKVIAKNRGNLLAIHGKLIKSDLLKELLKELKKKIRNMTSADQTFNMVNFLTQTSSIVLSHSTFSSELDEERTLIASKIRNLLDSLILSNSDFLQRADESLADLSSSSTKYTKHAILIDLLQDLIALKKKFKMIGDFLKAFFKHDVKHLKNMPKTGKLQTDINQKCISLVHQWDQRAKQIIEEVQMEMEDVNLLELDSEASVMTTNFPIDLIELIKAIKILKELGFESNISREVKKFIDGKKGIYNSAIKLRKITEFYNSLVDLDTLLLTCHRPLLLDKVIVLENLVKSTSGNLEKEGENLRNFITSSEAIIESFNNLNSKLKNTHNLIVGNFIKLYDADLIGKKLEWKKTIAQAKDLVQKVCSEIRLSISESIGSPEERSIYEKKFPKYILVWTNHLSWQLLKVLVHQLKRSLMKISDFIPSISLKIRLSNPNRAQQNMLPHLVFSPSIPALRTLLYNSISEAVSFPNSLDFFSNWNFYLGFIPSQIQNTVMLAYKEADKILSKTVQNIDRLNEYCSLLGTDWTLIERSIAVNSGAGPKQKQDMGKVWSQIVKVLREKRREIELMDSKVLGEGCVAVDIENFKSQAETGIENLLAKVLSFLDKSLASLSQEVEEFLKVNQEKLDKQPKSADELRQAWELFDTLQSEVEGFKINKVTGLKNRVDLVTQLGRAETKSAKILQSWEAFETRVKNFKQELRDKQQNMKTEMEKQIGATKKDIEKFESKWTSLKLRQDEEVNRKTAKSYLQTLDGLKKNWEEFNENLQRLKKDLDHFGIESHELELAEVLKDEIAEELDDWKVAQEFEKELSVLENKKHVGNSKNIYELQDLLSDWQNRIKNQQRDRANSKKPASRVLDYLLKTIEELQTIWPGLKLMVGEAFQREHWTQLMQILGISSVATSDLTFGHILSNPKAILSRLSDLRELSARAQGEVTIREAIEELDTWCSSAEFELTEYKDVKGNKVPLIKEWNDMMSKVGDNQALLQSIKDSKFYSRFKDRILQFDKRIGGLENSLIKIQVIQRKWLYLEPIFGKGALVAQQERFDSLNHTFQSTMRQIQKQKKIASLNEISSLDSSLDNVIEQIEICQSALNKFLEETRNRFPRFFFLGDEDLLEILGQSENPKIIKMHLKKIFAGIFDVEFRNSGVNMQIVSMIGCTGETVSLVSPVMVDGNLESWLKSLQKGMVTTLQESLKNCIKEKQLSISQYPGEILGITKEVEFKSKVTDAIEKRKLEEVLEQMNQFLDNLTSARPKLNKIDQIKVKNLIMDIIHQISVLELLVQTQTHNINNWHWFKQLKFSCGTSGNQFVTKIKMASASFLYTYEYQGIPSKLVHTPLTDKCYLTLTQGMNFGFGGNPYGPAGTGKTETVKALGSAFGRMVLVFNCDENLDFKSMGRIFIGLVKCGAWGCFDEFNRLLEAELSAISQQIMVIQDAIKGKIKNLNLMGSDLEVDFNAGIFVTLNPAGKGYGGRSKLPDNLKLLFRPVAMSRPDNELIAEVMLYSEGFRTARILSKKVVDIFNLSKQILSHQQHYDWGLRALKTILNTAGELIQIQRDKNAGKELNQQQNSMMEAEVLLKSLRDNTTSKLTSDDLRKFNLLSNDVLPGVKVPEIKDEKLLEAVEKTLLEQNLDLQDRQIQKIMQFYTALRQRMGVVIMGPSGSGKSTIWRVLQSALKSLKRHVKVYIMNPKAISRSQLLGRMDVNTREFKDGVLTAAARKAIKSDLDVFNWIICDGDVDPKWIEALNSVLDDNHLLTLPTGERISFGDNVNFIFETHDLKFASPATVSRMGMIYLNNDDVNVSSLVSKWKRDNSLTEESKLSGFISQFFSPVLKLLLGNLDSQCITTTQLGMILNLLTMVKGTDNKKEFALWLMRGMISNFDEELRLKLIEELQGILGEKLSFTQSYNQKTQTFQPLKMEASSTKASRTNGLLCVRTAYVQANIEIIDKILLMNESLIIVGPQGCGKNLMIQSAIQAFTTQNKIRVKVAEIFCNSQTNSSQIISTFGDYCQRSVNSQGPILRPKDCNRLIVLLRDINLAKPDEYESIELISFLQQLHSHRGFYDEHLEFTQIDQNIQFLVSMNPSSDIGRHELSTRLTANMRILRIDYPSLEDMKNILKETVNVILSQSKSDFILNLVKSKPQTVDSVAGFLFELFTFVKENFNSTSHHHYHFTPKNINSVLENLLCYEIDNEEDLSICLAEECKVLFRNRFVGADEISKYDNTIRKLFSKYLKGSGTPKDFEFSSLVKKTEEFSKLPREDYIQILQKSIVNYERENIELNLCLTAQTVSTIQTLEKILSKKGAKALLIGKSGNGRALVCKILSHSLNMEFETFNISYSYNSKQFKKELRRILEIAGVQNQKVMIYMEEQHIVEPSFLEDINSLLASNEVTGLFAPEEIDFLLKDQADEVRNEFYGSSLQESFKLRINRNLRIVLSMDSGSEKLESYLTNNPAILKKCDILWMRNFNSDTLKQLASSRLRQTFVDIMGNDAPTQLYDSIVEIHESAGKAPVQFFSLLELYSKQLTEKIESLKLKVTHMSSGLLKIKEANSLVDSLSAKAATQKKELSVKQKEANLFLKQIEQTYESASEQKREAEDIREFLKKEEGKTIDQRMTIQNELEQVQPIVDAAKKQVGSISKNHITELRSYATPASAIMDVFNALFMLMGIGDASWPEIKKQLGAPSFKETVVEIDARQIKSKVAASVRTFIKKNPGSFEREAIFRVSQAAGPIAEFVKAIVKLNEVYEAIAPLEEKLQAVDAKLSGSRRALAEKDRELKKIDDKVSELKKTFSEKTAEAEVLKLELQEAEEKIEKATVLLSKLKGEESRWQSTVEDLKINIQNCPRDALLSSSFITYLSGGNEEFRKKYLEIWKQTLERNDFNFLTFMAEESTILSYISQGLPTDQLGSENSIAVLNSDRAPLVIDPDNNFSLWLINNLTQIEQVETQPKSRKNPQDAKSAEEPTKSAGAEIVFANDKKLATTLELAIRFGKTIVVKEADGIHPMYFPLLKKSLKKVGPRMVIQLGDKIVDWNSSFKLIFLSRNSVLKLDPFSENLVTKINNLVTSKGLEQKLLSLVINHERPDIEQKKKACLEQERTLKVEIAKLEEKLLTELANSSGNILENKELLESLNNTKIKSSKISESLEQSKLLQQKLESERNIYLPLATKGTEIFLQLKEFTRMNHMYAFSLQEFTLVFKQNLQSSAGGSNEVSKINELVLSLQSSLFKMTFTRFGYCMFKKDKLTLALHLIRRIPDACSEDEYNFLLGRTNSSDSKARLPPWADDSSQELFGKYCASFGNIVKGLNLDNEAWIRWFKSEDPESQFPQRLLIKPIHKVILAQIFRPDKLERSLEAFAASALGINSLNESVSSVSVVYAKETDPETPILFITSLGSDPSKELDEFAIKQVGPERFIQLSMGGGQNEIALKLLEECAAQGKWLFFKNLHLVPGFLVTLEKTFRKVEKDKNFKLWLTSEEQNQFPIIFLENCFKVSYESPPGLKLNVQRVYLTLNNQEFKSYSPEKARLIYLLAYFHAILQERRIYIPQGWSKYYEFSSSDFKAGCLAIETIINQNVVDWPGLFGLMENAIYGGRIDKQSDMNILKSYMRKIFNESNLTKAKIWHDLDAPKTQDLKEHLKVMQTLPEQNTPEVFGLPKIFENSLQRKNVEHTINSLKALGLGSSRGAEDPGEGATNQKLAIVAGPLIQLWKSLLSKIMSVPELVSPIPQMSEDVMISTIQTEILSRQKIIKNIGSIFKKLDQVIQGSSVMTSQLKHFSESLIANRLPQAFSDIWDGCLYPEEWIRIIGKKTLGLKHWIDAIKNDQLFETRLPLSAFIDPEVVLNSLRQKTCRMLGTSLDKLSLNSTFSDPVSKDGKIYLQVGDMVLEGSSLKGSCLEADPNTQEKTRIKSVFLFYELKDEQTEFLEDSKLEIPVYLSEDKDMFLLNLKCAFLGDKDDIIIAGTSFYLIQQLLRAKKNSNLL